MTLEDLKLEYPAIKEHMASKKRILSMLAVAGMLLISMMIWVLIAYVVVYLFS